MAEIPAERLAELRALADAASEGPWTAGGPYMRDHEVTIAKHLPMLDLTWDELGAANAAFIAEARTALPELLAEVERLRVELAEFTQHLAYGELPDDVDTLRRYVQYARSTALHSDAGRKILRDRVADLKRQRDEARDELAEVKADRDKAWNHARGNAESYRREVNNIVAGYVAEIEKLKANQSPSIPVLGDVEMCPEHGCARWMCECFPAPSGVVAGGPDLPVFGTREAIEEARASVALDGDTFSVDGGQPCVCGHPFAVHSDVWGGRVHVEGARCNLCFTCNIYRAPAPREGEEAL